jgi:hypothetical protein
MASDETPLSDRDDPRYRRAARLLAQKLGVDWRDLPPEQVIEYLRKIEIARDAARQNPERPKTS